MTDDRIRTSSTVHLQTAGRRSYRARFVSAGRIRRADDSPGPFILTAEAIQDGIDRGLFTGLSAFIDHPRFFEAPSLRNLAGATVSSEWDDDAQAAAGTIRLFDNPAGNIIASLFDQVLADDTDGEPIPDVGLSIVFWPRWKPRDNAGNPLVLASFRHIESVDFVFQPAADGRVEEALTALSALGPDTIWGSQSDPGPGGHSPNGPKE